MIGIQPPRLWPDGTLCAAYADRLRRINVYDGSVRSAKTITSLLRWCKWLREGAPPGSLMLAGRTEGTVYRNIIVPLIEILGTRYVFRVPAGGSTTVYSILGRRHYVVGASDEQAEGKIRGWTLAGAYGDEMSLWPESFFRMTMSRLSLQGSVFLGTTNPDTPAHWLNREYLLRADELDLARWRFKLTDNPWLSENFVSDLRKENRGLWAKRFIDGLWVVAEGAVYDMLDDHLLVKAIPSMDVDPRTRQPGLAWTVAGVDYGTTNPTHFLALSGGREGGLFCHHEWRHDSKVAGSQLTIPEQSKAYQKWAATLPQLPERVYVDPSANALILQLYRDGVQGVTAADNEVLRGIQDVSALFGDGLLHLETDSTVITWRELTSYAWDPKATAKGKDAPIKVDDHAPDALRYAVRGTKMKWRPMLKAA